MAPTNILFFSKQSGFVAQENEITALDGGPILLKCNFENLIFLSVLYDFNCQL